MSTSADLQEDVDARSDESGEGVNDTPPESADNYEGNLADLQLRLRECLNNVPSAGSFAYFKTEPCAVNPGIYVKDAGAVGLPLTGSDVRILIGQSVRSLFTRSTETIIDTTMRKTWELNSDQFELRNPAWPPFLQNIVAHVAKELGAGTGVQADLHKLLLYESDGCFKALNEYCHGRFTRNPSQHEGGDVRATYAGDNKIFSTAPTSMFDQSYIAWYSDVIHEIQPLVSGVRCCLTYNLISTGPAPVLSATDLQSEKMKLKETFASWRSDRGLPNMQAYMLDHDYPEANLNYDWMKGLDRIRARCLKEMCAETGFCFYFAQMGYSVSGNAEDEVCVDPTQRGVGNPPFVERDSHREQEQWLALTSVFELDGSLVARSVRFDKEDIVQLDPFADRDPDDEEWENKRKEGVTAATHFYRNSCALIVKKEHRAEIIMRSDGEDWTKHFNFRIETLSERYRETPNDSALAAELIYLCEHVVSKPHRSLTSFMLCSVVRVGLLVGSDALIKKAMTVYPEKLGYDAYTEFGRALHGLGLGYLFGEEMNHALSCIATMHERYQALEATRAGYCKTRQPDSSLEDLTKLEVWIREKVEALLDMDDSVVTDRDAETLLAIYQAFGDDLLFRTILPFLRRQSTTFTTSFLARLLKEYERGGISEDATLSMFQNMLPELIPFIEIDSETYMETRQKPNDLSSPGHGGSGLKSEGVPQRVVRGQAIADLLGFCLSLHFQDEIAQILEKLGDQKETVSQSAYHHVFFPCLSRLFEFIQPRGRSPETSCFRSVFVSIINTYRKRFLQGVPTKGTMTEEEWRQGPWRKRHSAYNQRLSNIGPIPLLNDFLRKDSQSVEPYKPGWHAQRGPRPELIDLLD